MREAYEILNSLLRIRGIESSEDISEFLSDRPKKTYDPFLLLNMEAGVDLLLSEIKSGTKICIYGDYDADGVTSVCILTSVLSHLTDNLIHYIPSRFSEGYGLNKEAITKLAVQGVGLLVTVDCGSVSYDEVQFAKALGMKVIVTDHHSIDDVKPDCILINPKQEECQYPFKELAGCGVAFKLAQAVQQRTGLPKKVINDVLDLVAVGTVGDVVALTDENRTMVKYGLNKINSASRISLKKLTESISLKWVKSENIAFGIAPHINAAGRMADAEEAVKLFTLHDEVSIQQQVDKLIECNRERKKKQEEAYEEGIKVYSQQAEGHDFIILNMPDIHEGIGGIVAGKLKEYYNRPVVIVTPSSEGYLKGTGRSIDSVNLYTLLKKTDYLFERFGGHKSACGFLMKEENLAELRENVLAGIQTLKDYDPNIFDIEHEWDMEISPSEITGELYMELEKLEPCGQANPSPAFLMKDVMISNVKFMGEDGTHGRFTAVSADGGRADCVLFGKAQEKKSYLIGGQPADIIGTLDLQVWQGRKKVQFMVEEIL